MSWFKKKPVPVRYRTVRIEYENGRHKEVVKNVASDPFLFAGEPWITLWFEGYVNKITFSTQGVYCIAVEEQAGYEHE